MTDGFYLPFTFVDEDIKGANHTYCLVYILGQRYAVDGELIPNNALFALHLGILESDVVNAWKHWEQKGLISRDGDKLTYAQTVAPAKKVRPLSTKTRYNSGEISEFLKKDSTLAMVYAEVEKLLSKTLSSSDMQTLFWIYDYLGLPAEVILLMVSNSVENKHSAMHYIEKVALTWSENGINSQEKAEAYLTQQESRRTYEFAIKKLLGITHREFTKSEQTAVDDWRKHNVKHELIELAYDININNTSKLSMKYMNGIINNWRQNNITDLEQAKQNVAPPKASKQAATKFTNFEQREYDFDNLEKLIQQRRQRRWSNESDENEIK